MFRPHFEQNFDELINYINRLKQAYDMSYTLPKPTNTSEQAIINWARYYYFNCYDATNNLLINCILIGLKKLELKF